MKKKTEYYLDIGHRYKRRIWEDENGIWFTLWRGERQPVDREHYKFFIKHQDDHLMGEAKDHE